MTRPADPSSTLNQSPDLRSPREIGLRSQVAARPRFLESVYDFCLVVAIVCVPLTMAGIHETGVAIFVFCSLTMGVVWAIQQLLQPTSTTRFSGVEVLILLATGLVGLQLAHLSPSVLAVLSPFSAEYLTLWGTSEGRLLGTEPWQQISLTPELTRSGFVLLLAYAIFFLTLVHRLRTASDIDRVIRLIAVAASIMAIVGLGQLFFGNGKYLWLFEHPNRDATGAAKGTFVNQNHFAGFLALGMGPLIWCWQTSRRQTPAKTQKASWRFGRSSQSASTLVRDWPGIAVAAVILAGLFSLSRGGIAVLVIAFAFTLIATSTDFLKAWRLALPAAAFAIAGVMAFGADLLTDEFHSVTSASSFQELWAGRYQLWGALLQAMPSFWPAGSGLGSHAEVYPTWLSIQNSLRFSHAENGYLQVLLELGVPGLLLLLSGIGLCTHWCWKSWKQGDRGGKLRIAALAAGLLVGALHSMIDFVWYIPGYMIVTLAIAACACRCFQLTTISQTPVEPVPGRCGTMLAWTLLLCVLPIGRISADVLVRNVSSSDHWNAYRSQAIRGAKQLQETSTASLDSRLELMIAQLEKCVQADPEDHRALSNLAALYLRRFELNVQSSENRMTLRQIQDTVRNAEFDSEDDIREWLFRAFGDDAADLERALAAAQQGLQGQPLRGEAYIVLAEVGFLAGLNSQEKSALIDQAVRLRPHKPPVLYSAGSLTAESGDLDGAFELWKQAYTQSPVVRRQLVSQLAPHLSTTEFAHRLDPGPDGLWLLFEEYGRIGRTDEQLAAARLFAQKFDHLEASSGDADLQFWMHAHVMLSAIGEKQAALDCLQQAVHLGPQNDAVRRTLIFALIGQQEFEAALRQLDWYRLRYPDDEQITAALREVRGKLADQKTAQARERRRL